MCGNRVRMVLMCQIMLLNRAIKVAWLRFVACGLAQIAGRIIAIASFRTGLGAIFLFVRPFQRRCLALSERANGH